MAGRANAHICGCTGSMALDVFDAILCQPFERRLPYFALAINVCVDQGSGRHAWPGPRRGFHFLGINDRKAIMVGHTCRAHGNNLYGYGG